MSATEPAEVRMPAAWRAAGALSVVDGLGFGLGALVALDHLGRTGELPMTPFGFRAFGGGPFDALDHDGLVVMLWAIAALCAVDTVAGIALWRGRRPARRSLLATSPVALGFGWGFALPFRLLVVLLRVPLLLGGRRAGREPQVTSA